jgi:hypothetical protein
MYLLYTAIFICNIYWPLLCNHSKRQIGLEPCQITAEVEGFDGQKIAKVEDLN